MSPLLAFEEVALERGGRLLFEGISWALEPGAGLLVSGPNGSGKSSLIRLAAGLLDASAGRVLRNASIALADDRLALDQERPLIDSLGFWVGRIQAAAGLETMGIEMLAEVPVRLLSSGQRRRAALARVIGSKADLWLLDEPLNALDTAGASQIESAIADHRSAGGAVLAASHVELAGDWRRLELER